MRAKRVMGKASFVKLEDVERRDSSFPWQQQTLGEVYTNSKGWDVGDVIAPREPCSATKTGRFVGEGPAVWLLRPIRCGRGPLNGHGSPIRLRLIVALCRFDQ